MLGFYLMGRNENITVMSNLIVLPGCLEHPAVQALLHEHLAAMSSVSPPESCHALDASELENSDITFWSAWEGDVLAGCGALKELDSTHGEIKSMRTCAEFLRRGVAARVLETILRSARERGYERVSLETGSMAEFSPACRLYERYGFEYCPPFADYAPDPNSLFMTLALDRIAP
jgi:putative acetyltransferase